MYDNDIGFYLRNEAALRSCEKHYLSDDSDCYDDNFTDSFDDCPYDTTEEAYD